MRKQRTRVATPITILKRLGSELRLLADQTPVKDGGTWPVNPQTGLPVCDRCDRDATRVVSPSPEAAVFFCDRCDEHDVCDVHEPIVRRGGDPNSPPQPEGAEYYPCWHCQGSGELDGWGRCSYCDGTGDAGEPDE